MTAVLATLVALLAGLVGAFFGHMLSERKSRNDELAKMRLEAYCDFISATSHLVAARRAGRTKDDIEDLGILNDAKARICICSDNDVVEALESFWLQGGTLEKEQEILAFTRLCRAMRASLGNKSLGQNHRLSDVLFRLEPSTYSYLSSRAVS